MNAGSSFTHAGQLRGSIPRGGGFVIPLTFSLASVIDWIFGDPRYLPAIVAAPMRITAARVEDGWGGSQKGGTHKW
jgi:hypothetical protein